MLRLDKFLCDMNIGSRSQVKALIKQGAVTVNGTVIVKSEVKIDEHKDIVVFNGTALRYQKYAYYMLHKPKGVVSATEDNSNMTVIDLLKETGYKDLFPVGRLDKDTEGLLLITNDGRLAHDLLSPKKHIDKVYYVELEKDLSEQSISHLESGVDIGEDKITLPSQVKRLTTRSIHLTITEGKYHQVKRMMQAVDNAVIYLKRIAMGSLQLDESLPAGSYRELTENEISQLKNINAF